MIAGVDFKSRQASKLPARPFDAKVKIHAFLVFRVEITSFFLNRLTGYGLSQPVDFAQATMP
jgi:hypothetical protein